MNNKFNISIKKGTDFYIKFRIKDTKTGTVKDLTDYTGRMKVKDSYTGAVVATANVSVDNNTITATISKTDTATMPAGAAVYDIDLIAPDGKTLNLLSGDVTIENNTNI